jgi:hypothetical protein
MYVLIHDDSRSHDFNRLEVERSLGNQISLIRTPNRGTKVSRSTVQRRYDACWGHPNVLYSKQKYGRNQPPADSTGQQLGDDLVARQLYDGHRRYRVARAVKWPAGLVQRRDCSLHERRMRIVDRVSESLLRQRAEEGYLLNGTFSNSC